MEQKARNANPRDRKPGRDMEMPVPPIHEVLGEPLHHLSRSQVNESSLEWVVLGAPREFWQTPGVITTAVGYSAGLTKNPTYEEVCSGLTGHNEVVLVAYNPEVVDFADMLTFGKTMILPRACVREMTSGPNIGQVFMSPTNSSEAWPNRAGSISKSAERRGYGTITTEILLEDEFYYAEHYHQQYLHKVPNGYCGLGGTGVSCPTGIAVTD